MAKGNMLRCGLMMKKDKIQFRRRVAPWRSGCGLMMKKERYNRAQESP